LSIICAKIANLQHTTAISDTDLNVFRQNNGDEAPEFEKNSYRTLFPNIQDEMIPRCAETYRRLFNENMKAIQPQAFSGVVETLSILHQKVLQIGGIFEISITRGNLRHNYATNFS